MKDTFPRRFGLLLLIVTGLQTADLIAQTMPITGALLRLPGIMLVSWRIAEMFMYKNRSESLKENVEYLEKIYHQEQKENKSLKHEVNDLRNRI